MSTFICDLCDREFEFKYEIIVHLKYHESGKVARKVNKNKSNDGKYQKLTIQFFKQCS